jgi:hypothetical protein
MERLPAVKTTGKELTVALLLTVLLGDQFLVEGREGTAVVADQPDSEVPSQQSRTATQQIS